MTTRFTRDQTSVALAVLLGISAFAGLVALGDRTQDDIVAALIASVGAGATSYLVARSPLHAFAVLLILASLSAVVITLPFGHVRLEQPAIVAALVTLVAMQSWPRRSDIAAIAPIAGTFAIYLVVLTLASLLHAPRLAVSARLIIWTMLSMSAGVATFLLIRRAGPNGTAFWFTATGAGHALLGIAIAIDFLLLGPAGIPGMQLGRGEAPKVAGLAFEANLYASMLGALAPFAIERFRSRQNLATALAVIVILAGLGLGVTRGAYIGLGVGLVVYVGMLVLRGRTRTDLLPIVPVLAVSLLLAPSVGYAMLPSRTPIESTPTPSAALSPGATGSGAPGGSSASPAPIVPPATPSPTPSTDTLAFRLDRIPVAIHDLRQSPIIGLGAASFGQLHELPDRPGIPDYISILALSALYESGIIGAAALAMGFLLSLRIIWKASGWIPGLAAAFAASIISLLVAYEASNALFFSLTWIILGAALAFALDALETGPAALSGMPPR